MARRSKTYVELEGQEDFRRALARLEFGVLRELKDVVAVSAAEIEAGAKSRCPVSEPGTKSAKQPPPGTTRKSIRTILRDFGLSATIGSGWFVARFIEQGIMGRPARPFLNPAFQEVRPKYLARVEAAVDKAGREASIS